MTTADRIHEAGPTLDSVSVNGVTVQIVDLAPSCQVMVRVSDPRRKWTPESSVPDVKRIVQDSFGKHIYGPYEIVSESTDARTWTHLYETDSVVPEIDWPLLKREWKVGFAVQDETDVGTDDSDGRILKAFMLEQIAFPIPVRFVSALALDDAQLQAEADGEPVEKHLKPESIIFRVHADEYRWNRIMEAVGVRDKIAPPGMPELSANLQIQAAVEGRQPSEVYRDIIISGMETALWSAIMRRKIVKHIQWHLEKE